ncbi:MAG: LysM peptidoglycan-binding domain-containing protein [Clostridia bacterium]|nr:LysM peptidoglycan-binding domain-containing protein [Clostridia bacterium]
MSHLPYSVREGDTLYKIALSYNTSVSAILAANTNLNAYNLNPGQVICVPLPEQSYPKCRTTNYYIVREGDTFFSIARYFGVDLDELLAANVGIEPENIFEGLLLCIPIAPSPVCMKIKSDGTSIEIINDNTGEAFVFPSRLESDAVLMPQSLILTKKRLESGAKDGAKELLFSPFDLGIRGEEKMRDESAEFIQTDDGSMLEIFNLVPVGTRAEVVV